MRHTKQKAPTHLLCLFGRWKSSYRRWERRLIDIAADGRPCERLWAAVLSNNIVDLYATQGRGGWVAAAARAWFEAPCPADEVGSLAFVCEQLDLPDPAVIRQDVFDDRKAGRREYERQRHTVAKGRRGGRG